MRIVDLDRFHELWRELTHEEGDELIHRIGYLNAGNPMSMEWGGRVYKLNLKIPDEYKMAEALVKLAILEPGTNWVGERFKQKETNKEWSPGRAPPPGRRRSMIGAFWNYGTILVVLVVLVVLVGRAGAAPRPTRARGAGSNQGFCAAAGRTTTPRDCARRRRRRGVGVRAVAAARPPSKK